MLKDICHELDIPFHFLLENTTMRPEHMKSITETLGVQPILVNAADCGWHWRRRLIWLSWDLPPSVQHLLQYDSKVGCRRLYIPQAMRKMPPLSTIFKSKFFPISLAKGGDAEYAEGRFTTMSCPLKPGMKPHG